MLGPTILALLLGFGVMVWVTAQSLYADMTTQVSTIARIMCDALAYQLASGAPDRAAATLQRLETIPELWAASLIDRDGNVVATFPEGVAPPLEVSHSGLGAVLKNDRLYVVESVRLEEKPVATLHLAVSTHQLEHKIRSYLVIMLSLMGMLMVLASITAIKLHGVVMSPILRLRAAAERVSREGDYSIRVEKVRDDEVGALCDTVNLMLSQLEQRQTQDERVEARLRRSEGRFRSISERCNDAILVLRHETEIVYVNPQFLTLSEYSLEEVMAPGFDPLQLVAPASRELIIKHRQLRAEGRPAPQRYEFQSLTKSGQVLDVEASTAEIEWDQEQARLVIFRDVSRRKNAEEALLEQQQLLELHTSERERYAEELERSNRELNRFAYVVSHDLRAPLRGIANLASWIEEDLGSELRQETRTQITLLQQRVHRMENLITDILKYSRAGRVELQMEIVNVGELIQQVVSDLGIPQGITVRVGKGMPTIETKRVLLAQVLQNLIGNAVKHHDKNAGVITVSAKPRKPWYLFSVADDGPGIEKQYHGRITDMFQTLKGRDECESTGVGLALVKKIVEEQGGWLKVVSEQGQGATFTFAWPQRPPRSGANEQEQG